VFEGVFPRGLKNCRGKGHGEGGTDTLKPFYDHVWYNTETVILFDKTGSSYPQTLSG
jgi:hypothetical protein